MMLEVLKAFLYKDRIYQAGEVLAIGSGSEEVRRAVTAVRSGYLVRMTIKEAYNRMLQHCREVGAKDKREVLEAMKDVLGIGEGRINPPAKGRGTKRGKRGRKMGRAGQWGNI